MSFLSDSEYKCNYTIFNFFIIHTILEYVLCPRRDVFEHLWLPTTGAKRERGKKHTFGWEIKTYRFEYRSTRYAGTRMEMNSIAAHNRFSNENIIILLCFVGAVIKLVSFFILKSCDSFVCGEENRSGFMCMSLVYLLLWPGALSRCVVVSSCSYWCGIPE